MAILQKIPLQPDTTDQIVSVELDGAPYTLRVLWNERFGYFALSVLEADETPILRNIKMVKNYPLTSRYKDVRLPLGSFYFVQEKGSVARPGYGDLATNFNLYYFEVAVAPTPDLVRGVITDDVLGTIWDSGSSTWDSGSTTWDM
jgi:hypothetical protein